MIQSGAVFDVPAEVGGALSAVGMYDDSLAPIVHSKTERGGRAVDELHAKELRGEALPIAGFSSPNANITERLDFHISLLAYFLKGMVL